MRSQETGTEAESLRIQDHALIGDGRSAALISRGGSIDWLCWPRFDSPSLFGALLDPKVGGRWSIHPLGPAQCRRRYLEDSNVLETRFTTPSGELVLTDFMPVASEEEKRTRLLPEHELVRRVACERGEVDVVVHFDPCPDYGRRRPRWEDTGRLGLRLVWKRWLYTLRGETPLRLLPEGGAVAEFRLRAGEARAFSLSASTEGPAVLPPLGRDVDEKLARTVAWWRRWALRTTYRGPFREQVMRSALALKLLVFAPSGAIVAAPTTSLPERLGGDLNWDYRFCWLRDAALTVRALFGLGYPEEAEAFVSWLLHTTRLTWPELRVLYDVYGEKPLPERELSHLAGHRGARPVRVGNAARDQLQLDVYGEVIDAAAQLVRQGGTLDREMQRMLVGLGDYVHRSWRHPDEGIWEPRHGPRHHTHSRVLCWTALERLLELHRRGALQRLPVARFEEARDAIRQEVEARGFNPRLGSYTQQLDGETLDASLLLLSWYGFEPAGSPRMQGTWRRIQERLGAGPGLLYRYEESRTAGEGAFAFCSFWAAEFLARGGGSLAQAHRAFTEVLPYANDVGLFAEEMEPATGEPLGNFPQAFTHVGLINAALALEERARHDAAAPWEARLEHATAPSEVAR